MDEWIFIEIRWSRLAYVLILWCLCKLWPFFCANSGHQSNVMVTGPLIMTTPGTTFFSAKNRRVCVRAWVPMRSWFLTRRFSASFSLFDFRYSARYSFRSLVFVSVVIWWCGWVRFGCYEEGVSLVQFNPEVDRESRLNHLGYGEGDKYCVHTTTQSIFIHIPQIQTRWVILL